MNNSVQKSLFDLIKIRGKSGNSVHLQIALLDGVVFVILEDVDPANLPIPSAGIPVLSWAGQNAAHHRVYAGEEGHIGFEPWVGPWPGEWLPHQEQVVCLLAAVKLGVAKPIPMGIARWASEVPTS